MAFSSTDFLYKYESINKYSVENLRNSQIFFKAPYQFNDPFDCSLNVSSFRYSDEDLVELYNYLVSIGKLGSAKPIIDVQHFPEALKCQLPEVFDDCVKVIEERQRLHLGCTCFTKLNNHILMWAHYADSHRGMCLEFDTRLPPIDRAVQVSYSDEFPQINPIKIITRANTDILNRESLKPLLTKFTCWEYEAEWRLFHIEPNKLFQYPIEALKGVYLGVDVSDSDFELICSIVRAHNKGIKLYRAQKSKLRYEISFAHVD